MTDPTSPGSDSTWQPPQSGPGYGQPQSGQPYDQPAQYGQPTPPYGQPEAPQYVQPQSVPPQYVQPYDQQQYPQYGQPVYAQPVYVARPTNGMAIAALICALVGLAPIGAILGHVARSQIRNTGEQGDGLALAAIIIGWILTGIAVCACLGLFAIPAIGLFGTTSVSNQ